MEERAEAGSGKFKLNVIQREETNITAGALQSAETDPIYHLVDGRFRIPCNLVEHSGC